MLYLTKGKCENDVIRGIEKRWEILGIFFKLLSAESACCATRWAATICMCVMFHYIRADYSM